MRDSKGKFIKGHEVKNEWREITSIKNKGRNSWNKGLTKEVDNRVKDSSIKNSETKKKMAKENKISGLFKKKGLDFVKDKERENTQYKNGCKRPDISGDNNPMKRKEVLIKNLGKRGMSSLEIKYNNLFNELGLDLKFVGNGNFFVGNKCPDFINEKKKIAVEVFYKKHKEYFKGSCDKWIIERTKYFNSFGWNIIFLDETESNKNKIMEKINNDL
ncbi:MAG: hypothetical protein IMZ60_02780 [Actinobacteria bacterium]|nr:hypothetical protein [Actinomycetota bacterium]